jgi:hypothetical protein
VNRPGLVAAPSPVAVGPLPIGQSMRVEIVRRRPLVVILCLLGAACSSSSRTTQKTSVTTAAPSTEHVAVTAPCSTPSHFGTDEAANEIHGTSANGELWGLAFGHVPPRVGEELKIVWRMTGTGPLHVVFTAPDGSRQPLVFGPEAHPGSTYRRPGDEWGTGFRFTVGGCWHIHLSRMDTSGDILLDVRA